MIKSENILFLHPLMNKVNEKKILDYRLRTRTLKNSNELKYIPQEFNNKLCFISYNSFQQNYLPISKPLRKYVLSLINEPITAIGGESYLFSDSSESNFYTNNQNILLDAKFNNCKSAKLIDYNIGNIDNKTNTLVINLSKLNSNLLTKINLQNFNKIIIINCKHDDFWKKMKILTTYKLLSRKKFVSYKLHYFITVNVFVKKNIISLGGNCAIALKLQHLNLRDLTYPFDWSRIKIKQLSEILENDFENYNDVSMAKYSKAHSSYLIKNIYMTFAHQLVDNIDHFKIKLRNYKMSFDKLQNPTFVRLEISKKSSKYDEYLNVILSVLDKKFVRYKFILISKIKPNINRKNLQWFSLDFYDSDWRYPKVKLKEIICNY